MLLAVPLTMIFKVALDNSRELRWLGVAISQGKNQSPELERQIIKESTQAQKKKEKAHQDSAQQEADAEAAEDAANALRATGDQ